MVREKHVRSIGAELKRYFWAGILVLLPMAVTVWLLLRKLVVYGTKGSSLADMARGGSPPWRMAVAPYRARASTP